MFCIRPLLHHGTSSTASQWVNRQRTSKTSKSVQVGGGVLRRDESRLYSQRLRFVACLGSSKGHCGVQELSGAGGKLSCWTRREARDSGDVNFVLPLPSSMAKFQISARSSAGRRGNGWEGMLKIGAVLEMEMWSWIMSVVICVMN